MPLITPDLARYLGYPEIATQHDLFAIGVHFRTAYTARTSIYAQELAEEDLYDQPFALNIDESSYFLRIAAIRLRMEATIYRCWPWNRAVDQDNATGGIDAKDLDRWLESQIYNGPFHLPRSAIVSGDSLR